jgi:hypothetical protein
MHMLRYLTLLFLFLPFQLAAQIDSMAVDTATYIPFVAYWAMGDEYRYEVEKHDLRYEKDSLVKSDTTRYIAVFEVLDSTATSYRIRWHYEAFQPTETGAKLMLETTEDMQAALKNIQLEDIVFSTDEFGTFQQIENLDQIQATLDLYITKIKADALKELADDPERQASVAKALEVTFNVMRQRQYVENNMFVELIHLLHPMGSEFPAYDTLDYTDQFPNNFGEGVVNANGVYYFDTLILNEYYGHLKQFIDLDPDDTKLMLQDYFKQTGIGQNQMQELLMKSSYNISDNNDYYYYYDPGIPVYVDCMRTLTFLINENEVRGIKRYLLQWVD